MSKKRDVLKVYCLSMPQLSTDWESIYGDKYNSALTFDVDFVDSIEFAEVVVWDGVISKKMESLLPQIYSGLTNKILLLAGESSTHLSRMSAIRVSEINPDKVIELPGWTPLPEQILSVLESCFKKLKNV